VQPPGTGRGGDRRGRLARARGGSGLGGALDGGRGRDGSAGRGMEQRLARSRAGPGPSSRRQAARPRPGAAGHRARCGRRRAALVCAALLRVRRRLGPHPPRRCRLGPRVQRGAEEPAAERGPLRGQLRPPPRRGDPGSPPLPLAAPLGDDRRRADRRRRALHPGARRHPGRPPGGDPRPPAAPRQARLSDRGRGPPVWGHAARGRRSRAGLPPPDRPHPYVTGRI
jgi:hypothetical protein